MSPPDFYKAISLLLLPIFLLLSQVATAGNNEDEDPSISAPVIAIMPKILVEAPRVAPTTGTTILDKEIIDKLPTRNGSVNEIIGIVPGVQYSEDYNSSYTGGEITPPVVSISGSKFYDNNYIIDGVSNNSRLDPAFSNIAGPYKLPGHPQSHFLDKRLIRQITVYNSNIPAEFGDFMGGQVEVETLAPSPDFWGKISYRSTNDSWTEFHIHPEEKADFNNSDSASYQPDFDQHNFGAILNTPINIDTGLVSSYQKTESKIELNHFGKSKTQTRQQENIFLKLDHFSSNNSYISISGIASPATSEYFLSDFKNSDYSIKRTNYLLSSQFEQSLPLGKFYFSLGYSDQKIAREAPADRFFWNQTESIDWDTLKEGGLGDLKTGQKEWTATAAMEFNTHQIHTTSHQAKIGIELTRSKQYYRRPTSNYYYYRITSNASETDPATICLEDDPACIEGEQYLSRRTAYLKTSKEIYQSDLGLFFQDLIVWKRLEVFPGIRASYDNFTDNSNIAPRFSTALDVLGNGRTILFGGRNRYYSGTLLKHALYSSIGIENQTRDSSVSPWETTNISTKFNTSDIETPYSDETTVGIIQRFFGGDLKLQYISKKSRNEFARERKDNPDPFPDYYILNNEGRSDHDSYQVSWQRSWKNHFLEINWTRQETTTSNNDYDDIFSAEDAQETYWYNGKEYYSWEAPADDFNRRQIANLIYTYRYSRGITLNNVIKYRSPYTYLDRTREQRPSELNPDQARDPYIFEKVETSSAVTFDWHLSWQTELFSSTNVTFTIDVFNVFNKKIRRGTKDNYNYEIGRQIWAGVDLVF